MIGHKHSVSVGVQRSVICAQFSPRLGYGAYALFAEMNKISVKIVDSKGTHVEDQTFINPPKKASVVLGRLIAAGYAGSLLDKDGNSLCDDDKLDDTQVYRLVLPAPALTGMHCDSHVPGRSSCCP